MPTVGGLTPMRLATLASDSGPSLASSFFVHFTGVRLMGDYVQAKEIGAVLRHRYFTITSTVTGRWSEPSTFATVAAGAPSPLVKKWSKQGSG